MWGSKLRRDVRAQMYVVAHSMCDGTVRSVLVSVPVKAATVRQLSNCCLRCDLATAQITLRRVRTADAH